MRSPRSLPAQDSLEAARRRVLGRARKLEARQDPVCFEAPTNPDREALGAGWCVLSLSVHRYVPTRPFPDWSDAYNDLLQCLKQIRQDRITVQTKALKENGWGALKTVLQALAARPEARRYRMTPADIALLPEVRAVALGTRMSDENVNALHAQFGEAVEQWRLRACAKLRELVRASIQPEEPASDEAEVDPLELSTTKFKCRCCKDENEALFFPEVLSHRCSLDSETQPRPTSDAYEVFVHEQLSGASSNLEGRVWMLSELVVDETSEHSRKLVGLCGKDPKTATAKEMDEAEIWFVLDDESIMSWRAAVSTVPMLQRLVHDQSSQMVYQDGSAVLRDWRLATPEESERAQGRAQKMRDDATIWGCSACAKTTQSVLSDVLLHIEDV